MQPFKVREKLLIFFDQKQCYFPVILFTTIPHRKTISLISPCCHHRRRSGNSASWMQKQQRIQREIRQVESEIKKKKAKLQ